MSHSKKRNQSYSSGDSEVEEAPKLRNLRTRPLRRIAPLGMRVVIKIISDTDMSDAGLYLPEGAKQAMAESLLGEVLEVASAIDSDSREEENISGVPLGAKVLVKKGSGVKVPWDETLRIVETAEVLALVTEIEIT